MRNKIQHIILLVILLLAIPMHAKKPVTPVKVDTITTEQEQQFTYYWYAAKQAIVEERYGDAYVLLKFCNGINPNDGSTLCFLGILEQGMGNETKGLLLFHDAFEADPHDQWYQYSKALLEIKTPAAVVEALRVLEKAHEVQLKAKGLKAKVDEELLAQLQNVYLNTGQWKKALDIQDEIDQIKGYNVYSATFRYRIYNAWNDTKKAMAEVNRYLELDPTDESFLLFKLDILERTKGKKKERVALYERILELDPYNLVVLNNYAWMLAENGGDLQKAERMSAITIREEPNNPVYLDTYGWILHLQGQDELAKFYLQKALQNETEDTSKEIKKHLNAIK